MPPKTLEMGRSVSAALSCVDSDAGFDACCGASSVVALSSAELASHTIPSNSRLPKGTLTKVPGASISSLTYDSASAKPLWAGVWTITETMRDMSSVNLA